MGSNAPETDGPADGNSESADLLRVEKEILQFWGESRSSEPGTAKHAVLHENISQFKNLVEQEFRPPALSNFTDLEFIGSGGMGIVYSANQILPPRRVALKFLRLDARERARAALEREMQILPSLRHPNIASLFEAGRTPEGDPFLVLELIEGVRIDQYIQTFREKFKETRYYHKQLERELAGIFSKIASGLAHAHRRGVIHRDLKPSNIYINKEGEPRILDFGLAAARDLGEAAGGTLPYMSPEQAMRGEVHTSGDLYSLGVVLYELTSGVLPYKKAPETRADWGEMVHSESLVSIRTRAPGFSPDFYCIIEQLLQIDPARRPASADTLQNEFDHFLACRPVAAARGGVFYRMGKLARRRPAETAGLLALMFVLLTTGAVAARFWFQSAVSRSSAEGVTAILGKILEESDPYNDHDSLQIEKDESLRSFIIEAAEHLMNNPIPDAQVDAEICARVGNALRTLGFFDKSEVLLLRSLERRTLHFGPRSVEVARAIHDLGVLGHARLRLDEAEKFERESLAILSAAPTANPMDLIHGRADLAELLGARTEDAARAEAVQLAELNLITIREQASGPAPAYPNPLLARALLQYGYLLRLAGRIEQSLTILDEAKSAAAKLQDARILANVLFRLASVQRDAGLELQAFANATESLRIRTARLPAGNPAIADSHIQLSEFYIARNETRDALSHIEAALSIYVESAGPNHAVVIDTRCHRAGVLLQMKQNETVDAAILEFLDSVRAVHGEASIREISGLMDLARAALEGLDFARASSLIDQAEKIHSLQKTPNPDWIICIYDLRLRVLFTQKKFADARSLLEAALAWGRSQNAQTHPQFWRIYYIGKMLSEAAGDFESAIRFGEQQLESMRRQFGESHMSTRKLADGLREMRQRRELTATQPAASK